MLIFELHDYDTRFKPVIDFNHSDGWEGISKNLF